MAVLDICIRPPIGPQVVTELGRKDEEEVADETKYGSKAELTHGCEVRWDIVLAINDGLNLFQCLPTQWFP